MTQDDQFAEHDAAVSKTKPASPGTKPRRMPQYHVIVLNDDLHTFEYVIELLCRICGHTIENSYRLAAEIDSKGMAAVWLGSLEVAELKRDQIRGYGPDTYARQEVTFPLGCYIEPIE